ncbi:ATP synthase F0 subcomplex subunit OSCP atp5 [Toensbergia leucococca]|nr:ATP synthase F0 subcomplex subunit OSCP atp5 [Toensbergia leucococca]
MLSRQVRLLVLPSIASRSHCAHRAVSPLLPLLRTYAQVAPSQDSKPPVALFGLDGTYASALYTAAVKTSTLDSTSKSLAALADVFKKDPKLAVILTAPTLTSGDKSQIVAELQRHMGGVDKGDTVKNFLSTLSENNRLGILEGVCEKFATLMGATRGEVDLTVTSASKLDPKTLQRLETAVAKSEYSQGKKLKVVPKVNPDIMGGLVVEIGDRTIDLSVSSKVSKMNKLLTDAL